MSAAAKVEVNASAPSNETGYRTFTLGNFKISRDEYFVHVTWPAKGQQMKHIMSADAFLRAMMRDVAWGFFYGWVNFDGMVGTRNQYGQVEFYAGRYAPAYHDRGLDLVETFDTPADHGDVQGHPRGLDEQGLRSVRRPGRDRLLVGRQEERHQHAKPSTASARPASACPACPATPSCAPIPTAIR